jgi:hypothetical protein
VPVGAKSLRATPIASTDAALPAEAPRSSIAKGRRVSRTKLHYSYRRTRRSFRFTLRRRALTTSVGEGRKNCKARDCSLSFRVRREPGKTPWSTRCAPECRGCGIRSLQRRGCPARTNAKARITSSWTAISSSARRPRANSLRRASTTGSCTVRRGRSSSRRSPTATTSL